MIQKRPYCVKLFDMEGKTVMKIKIETLTDVYDCETCGPTFAQGGVVYIDDKEVIRREPDAYCYESQNFSASDLLVMALAKVGCEVLVDGEKYELDAMDVEYYTGEE
jgi:hypothetical protein